MTKGQSDYTGAGFGTAVTAYRQLSDVSLPDDVRSAPFLRDLCSDEAKGYLSSLSTSMLRPADEFAALEAEVFVEPYMDPALKSSRRSTRNLSRTSTVEDFVTGARRGASAAPFSS